METKIPAIDTDTLRAWLEAGKEVSVLDIRPAHERAEWLIPGSIHINAYDKLKNNDSTALAGLHMDKNVPVVAVCAGGKTSLIAADLLQKQGYKALSLEGGMKGWSLAWNTATLSFNDFEVVQVRRTGKGCLSYIVVSRNEALVFDASLPVQVYEDILKKNGWKLRGVLETHIHADHLSRSKQLAENNNVPLLLPAQNKVNFMHEPLNENQEIEVGAITIRAITTPGHTLESFSFLVNKEVLLTGDTLFTDGVGRPDLKANEEQARDKAVMLYHSLQKLKALNDHVIVLPAHTSKPIDFDGKPIQSTIAEIKSKVKMLDLNESDFVETILQRIPPAPANYLSIVDKNLKGDQADMYATELEAGANRCAIS